jgi:hypothetical protein
MPFKPKGELAQWRIVYRLLQEAEQDSTLTYDQLGEALDLDPVTDRHRIQVAVRRASKQLLEVDSRATEVVLEVGYKLVPAERQIPLAGQQVERASRALDRGSALTTHIRMNELDPHEQQIVQTMAVGFAQVAEWARQLNKRVESHDGRLADVEAELKRLRERSALTSPDSRPDDADA